MYVEKAPADPAVRIEIVVPYTVQKSLSCSPIFCGASTEIVRFVFVLIYPCVGTDKLKLGRLINLEGKTEPVEIFTNIGIVYWPT